MVSMGSSYLPKAHLQMTYFKETLVGLFSMGGQGCWAGKETLGDWDWLHEYLFSVWIEKIFSTLTFQGTGGKLRYLY